MPEPTEIRSFIAANLPLAPVPGVPEIRLHKAGPTSGLRRLAAQDEAGFGTPYWAYYWGGGLALARHLLDRPEAVAGRRVIDLGAGSGIVGIAAAMAGAAAVTAVEIDAYAAAAIALNAEANRVAVTVRVLDMLDDPPPPADLIAVGDLFYEAELARRATAFLDRCMDAGIEVLVGDPWRAFLPRHRLRAIGEYRVSERGGADATMAAAVFAMEPMAN